MSMPKLRFPEFKDAGDWDEKTLIDIADRINTRNTSNSVARVLSNSATDGVVDQRDYFDKDIANKDNLENYFVVDKGDYVYNPRISTSAPVGPISKNKVGRGVMSPLYTVFRFKSVKNDFFEQFYRTTLWHKYLKEVSNTGARHDRMAISNDDFMAMPLPYPHPIEQEKIADCLSSLDDLIAAHNQKLAALKTHKKGLMQQLFPAEGETVPKLRFPEFRDGGEWETKELQEVSTIIRGASPRPQGDPRYFGGSIPRLMGKDVSRDGKWVTPCTDFLTVEGAALSRFCQKGTLTIICSGDVGVPSFLAIDACIHDGFLALIDIDHTQILSDFLFYGLSNLQEKFSDSATHGGVFVNLTTTILKEFCVALPTPPEQQRIADCLSSLDDLITAKTKKLESLNAHKRGLMQQLFPQSVEAEA